MSVPASPDVRAPPSEAGVKAAAGIDRLGEASPGARRKVRRLFGWLGNRLRTALPLATEARAPVVPTFDARRGRVVPRLAPYFPF